MLQEGGYDVLEFSPPAQGMNQNISPENLPLDFAYILENIVAKPLGEGHVRFGTFLEAALNDPTSRIMKKFPFVNTDGSEQIIAYVQEYVQDGGATGFTFIEGYPYTFSFTSSHNAARYVKDTPIQVRYTFNGLGTIYDTIASVTVQGTTVTITLAQNALPPYDFLPDPPINPVINSVWYSTGTIYKYDVSSGVISPALRQNLSVGCVPRATTFLNTLVICNGVDKLLKWDGNALSEVYDFVKEQTANLTRIDNTHLSFTVSAHFNIADYAVGNLLQIKVNGVPTQMVIAASALNQQTLSITTTTNLPAFVPDQTNVFYQAWPPAFNFLFVAYDRLWGLGVGAVGLEYRNPDQAMRVFFMYKSGSLTDWFNENTKTVPSIDLSEKHGVPDNLEAIDFVNGYMVFIGREKTQVWTGSEPLGAVQAQGNATLTYNSTLSTGVVHGDLVIDLPNDTFFITKTGLQSFSSLNIAKQFAATSMNAVDPLIQQYVASITSSNVDYRASCSFKYDGGALAGFKIGRNKVICSLFSTSLYSWSLFSGDFLQASSFLTLGNNLYLSIGNKIFKYADSNDGTPPVYGDQNGQGFISFSWTLPVIHLKGRRFAGKRYEIQMDYPSSFTIRPENQMNIQISGDLPKSYQINTPCRFDVRGDALQTIPLTSDNPTRLNSLGFRLEQPYGFFKDRMKFLASKFWLTLSGYTKDGVLSIKKIKLYGIIERK